MPLVTFYLRLSSSSFFFSTSLFLSSLINFFRSITPTSLTHHPGIFWPPGVDWPAPPLARLIWLLRSNRSSFFSLPFHLVLGVWIVL
ncbi:hypothetical protein BDQ94DRAFT_153632 [Aspergillus welwitschiae]|uniref:Uncharacterized protein n=1 Tax=Aspergillus welwitschiae TaxID=1341132 RepID=A0A3F3PLK9_9EURO|nr:hypothetical protein BDQ94DRAFT_153632 [Aspergillus welwitschiae]RDH27662.1 hypothetical protein BDQ94DRAFT_153632 [Aspergillus welwitschiae]